MFFAIIDDEFRSNVEYARYTRDETTRDENDDEFVFESLFASRSSIALRVAISNEYSFHYGRDIDRVVVVETTRDVIDEIASREFETRTTFVIANENAKRIEFRTFERAIEIDDEYHECDYVDIAIRVRDDDELRDARENAITTIDDVRIVETYDAIESSLVSSYRDAFDNTYASIA